VACLFFYFLTCALLRRHAQPTTGYTTRNRVSMSIPIVLPITDFTKFGVEKSGKPAVALTTKDGVVVAILRNPEIYKNRKEEIVTRTFGVIDPGHPYIKHIYSGGDWLLGGEVELLGRIKYNDGLDQYRLTAKELVDEFVRRGADAVFAFQTRNPTHAGHAYLMKTAREKLIAKGAYERCACLYYKQRTVGGRWVGRSNVSLFTFSSI